MTVSVVVSAYIYLWNLKTKNYVGLGGKLVMVLRKLFQILLLVLQIATCQCRSDFQVYAAQVVGSRACAVGKAE